VDQGKPFVPFVPSRQSAEDDDDIPIRADDTDADLVARFPPDALSLVFAARDLMRISQRLQCEFPDLAPANPHDSRKPVCHILIPKDDPRRARCNRVTHESPPAPVDRD